MNLLQFLELYPVFFYTTIAVTGLLTGSFLNVVIYRLPKMMEREWRTECSQLLDRESSEIQKPAYNLLIPRSACPHCGHKISALENIPVASFIFLGGKCRECGSPISWRYPAVELISCISALGIALTFGFTIQSVLGIILTWALIVLTVIDFDHQLLPDNITLPFLWLGIIVNMFGIFTDVYSSLLGAIFGYMVLWIVYICFKLLTGKEGMGHGDFKLLAMLGAWLGWQYLPLIIIISSLSGSIVGLGLILFRSHGKSQPIPFGPYLALGGWISLMFGYDLITLYLSWATR